MIPVPIPDGMAESLGGVRQVIGDPGDPTGDVRPCEYVVTASPNYPGRPCVHVLVALDDGEREILAAKGLIMLTLDGGELPWRLGAIQAESPAE